MSKTLSRAEQKTIVQNRFRKELNLNAGKKYNFAEVGRIYNVPRDTIESWYNQVVLEMTHLLHQKAQGTRAAAAGAPWGSAMLMQAACAAANRAAIIPARSAARLPATGAVAAFVAGLSSQVSFARLTLVCADPISLLLAQRAMLLGRWRDRGGPLSPLTSAEHLSALPTVCRAATRRTLHLIQFYLTVRYAPTLLILAS
jgi:hypothetical protein